MNSDTPEDLIYAAFFFIDIVGLSNPVLSTETQRTKIKILNKLIYECRSFRDNWKESLLILPTGDGMLIGFKNGLEQPIKLSIELHGKLAEYNKAASEVEKIETRIGCNIGHVFVVEDIHGNINLWGPGAILARRVMDLGNAEHILVSDELANDLIEISSDYKKILHPLQNFGIKHGENLLIFSAFGPGFGNSKIPQEKIKITPHVSESEKNALCENMKFNITIKDKPDYANFERFYYFSNISVEPIYEVVVGIVTNSEEEFLDLNIKIVDEQDHELEISKILASTPYTKKILVKLAKPVFEGDEGRMIKMSYTTKLARNNFENFFLLDTNNFELNFNYFLKSKFFPKLYYIDNEEGNKSLVEETSKSTKGVYFSHHWRKTRGINVKDMIRLEW